MLPTVVVNIRRNEAYDVYIGRPNPRVPKSHWGEWGNPFTIGPDGTRDEVITKFREYLFERLRTDENLWEEMHTQLGGKRLGCFCAPEPCHGYVYAEIVDQGLQILSQGPYGTLLKRPAPPEEKPV